MLLRMKIHILPTHAILVWLKPAGTVGTVQALYLDRRLVRPLRHFMRVRTACNAGPETLIANISPISKPILTQFEAN